VFFVDRFDTKTDPLFGAGFVEDIKPGNAWVDADAIVGEAEAKRASIIVLSGFGLGTSTALHCAPLPSTLSALTNNSMTA